MEIDFNNRFKTLDYPIEMVISTMLVFSFQIFKFDNPIEISYRKNSPIKEQLINSPRIIFY